MFLWDPELMTDDSLYDGFLEGPTLIQVCFSFCPAHCLMYLCLRLIARCSPGRLNPLYCCANSTVKRNSTGRAVCQVCGRTLSVMQTRPSAIQMFIPCCDPLAKRGGARVRRPLLHIGQNAPPMATALQCPPSPGDASPVQLPPNND